MKDKKKLLFTITTTEKFILTESIEYMEDALKECLSQFNYKIEIESNITGNELTINPLQED